MIDIKEYDRRLFIKKNLDGSIDIKRWSEFFKTKSYDVFTIKNQYPWSMIWVLETIKSMDSRHIDFFQNVIDANLKKRNAKTDQRMHSDIADFMLHGSKIII